MLLLSLSLLTAQVDQTALLSSKSYELYLPQSFYTETMNQKEWVDDLYALNLDVKKDDLLQFSEETKNVYASYMDDFYGPEDLPYYDMLIGRPNYRILFHSTGWGGDSSGYTAGFTYIEQIDAYNTWGVGVERGEVKHSKHRPWNEGSFYHVDGFYHWRPDPDVQIYLGIDAYVPE